LRKSQNENLNFALPISEVLKASTSKAEVRIKSLFKLDISDRTLQGKLDETLDLPQGYQEFGRALQGRLSGFVLSMADRFNATYRDDMFPVAPGAQALLYRTNVAATFPRMLSKQRDGTWEAVVPEERHESDIGKNGQLVFGKMGNFFYLRLKAPDDASVAQMQKDSRLFMDLVLRGLYFNRAFGAERVRITSLGAAKEEAVHVDAYQRKWQVRRWIIEHSNEKIVTYALPQPDGFAILMNAADEASSYMYEADLKTLTDFAFVTYYGTLKQWKDFLSARDMLPAAFDSIALEADYGKKFSYRSQRLSLTYPDELMKVTPNSDLHLKFSYFKENGRVVWDVSSVTAGEDKDTSTFVLINRHPHPPETLPDADRQTWESLVNGRMPYTGTAFFDKSHTIIATAHSPQEAKGALAKLPLLYSVAYSVEGTQDAALMERKLERFREGLQVNEH
jgi:serine protease Do